MEDTLILIARSVSSDVYGREVFSEAQREIYCKVESISQSEFFNAANAELKPEYRFVVFFGDYEGEEICEFRDNRYSIYRTYRRGDDLELYVERKTGITEAKE